MANLAQIQALAQGIRDVQQLITYAQAELMDEQFGTENTPIWTARVEKLIGWRRAILIQLDELGHGVTPSE